MARVTSKKETTQRGPNNAHEHRIFRAEDNCYQFYKFLAESAELVCQLFFYPSAHHPGYGMH